MAENLKESECDETEDASWWIGYTIAKEESSEFKIIKETAKDLGRIALNFKCALRITHKIDCNDLNELLNLLVTRPPLKLTGGSPVKKSSFSIIFPVEEKGEEKGEEEEVEEEKDGKIRHWRSVRPKRNWKSKRATRRGPAPRKKRISIICDSMATIIVNIINISTKIFLLLQVIHLFIIKWLSFSNCIIHLGYEPDLGTSLASSVPKSCSKRASFKVSWAQQHYSVRYNQR